MIYLYCERCHEEHVFFPAEDQPPFDPHTSMCEACGFSFGYREQTVHGPHGRVEVQVLPVLEQSTVLAGLSKFRAERIERLRARGQSIENLIARDKFEATAGDLEARRRLTSSTAGTIDPALAEKVMRPQVPKRE